MGDQTDVGISDAGRDALPRVRVDRMSDAPLSKLPVRRTPSRNSVHTQGFRAIVLFVTVCTKDRKRVFANVEMVKRLISAWKGANLWHVGDYVIMPDHVHFMCSPSEEACDVHRWIAYWKSLFSRGFGEEVWQRGCWDTQIRSAHDYGEKIEYMRMNPVRKGLVAHPEDWPYAGRLCEINWHD